MNLELLLLFSGLLFVIGVIGVAVNRSNIIAILISIELMLLSVNINFVSFSYYLGDITGQIYTIFVLTVAAAEVAIGISILVIFYRLNQSVKVDSANLMKG